MSETDNTDPQQETKAPLMKELEDAINLTAQFKDEALRARAELENYRKRMIRDREDMRKNATIGLIEELLPVLDNLALGLAAAEKVSDGAKIVEGFGMVYHQLHAALSENGLTELNPDGETFDPNFHECVSMVADDKIPENNILQVVRVGYRLHERLLRPANVVVSSGPTKKEES